MSISPGAKGLAHRVAQSFEIVKYSRSFVVSSTHCRFSDIKMTVSARVIAAAKEGRVFLLRKGTNMQSMGGAEVHSHSEKNALVIPNLGKKIVAFV